jgi:hypothetical protein
MLAISIVCVEWVNAMCNIVTMATGVSYSKSLCFQILGTFNVTLEICQYKYKDFENETFYLIFGSRFKLCMFWLTAHTIVPVYNSMKICLINLVMFVFD